MLFADNDVIRLLIDVVKQIQTWYINTCRCESSGGKVPQNTRENNID
ncbi:hypothetical protein J2Z80_002949, partial [Thermoanaerobacterium butyriciformans]|nr:hypothetical protein [Thermoanaerobacterium butyriciformans]